MRHGNIDNIALRVLMLTTRASAAYSVCWAIKGFAGNFPGATASAAIVGRKLVEASDTIYFGEEIP